jgi:predicted transcriptional regulator
MAQVTRRSRNGSSHGLGICTNIGPREAAVLRVLSALGRPATAPELGALLYGDSPLAYSSAHSSAGRLVEKGFAERLTAEGAYLYRLCVDASDVAAQIAVEVITALNVDRDRVVCLLLGLDPGQGVPEIARIRAETTACELDPRVAGLLAPAARPGRNGRQARSTCAG